MTKELDKHEDATSSEGAASSPDKNQVAEAAPKRRVRLMVAMACVLALVTGIGLWGAQAAKETPALTTVAEQEASTSATVAKTEDKSKTSTSASSSAAATKATQPAKQESAAAASGTAQPAPQAASTPAPVAEPEKQAEPASSTQEAPKETVTEVTVTTTPAVEVPTETVVTHEEPTPEPESVTVVETVVEPEPEPTSMGVSVLVDGSAAGGGARDAFVELSIGASVYDALLASGANVNARGTVYGTYVAAIDGLAELEHGPMSGWVYAVNGVQPQTACSNYKLKDGDSIVWTYVNVE